MPPQHLQDGPHVGEAARLDEHVVESEGALLDLQHLEQLVKHALELPAWALARTAHAAVLEHNDAVRCILLPRHVDERVVDRHRPELILNHDDALAVVGSEHTVNKRRLAAAEKAGDDRDRHLPRSGLGAQ